jgi:DNA-binding transcriptional MocR family regulator
LRTHGITVDSEEVLITSGAQQAIDLILRALTRPGNTIAIETPTYGSAIPLFRFHGLDVLPVPMRPDGMDIEVLEGHLNRRRPALVYTIPNFHNPTGITSSQDHRERLLALCEKHRIPLAEDGFEEEMKYFGKAVLPIKSMDSGGTVIYIGTFSKVVFPGLRIGWIAAPRICIEHLAALQRISSLAGNTVSQAAVERFCSEGLYEAHLRRLHKVYRRRMQGVLQGLRDHMPAGVEWTQPAGGYTLWLRLPGSPLGEDEVHDRLLRDGVKLTPGSLFFPADSAASSSKPHFRLSVSCVDETEILEGCRRIGRTLRAVLGG